MSDVTDAPGGPGLLPAWTSSAKTGVGTALSALSRVSFTISHGILNEIYYPRIDQACTRDCGLIVTGPDGYFSEEKRDTLSTVRQIVDGVPGFELTNRSRDGRYTIVKRIVADPLRDVVLQRITFEAHRPGPYRLFVLLAPHLVNAGAHNTAFVATLKGWRMAFASGRGATLVLAANRSFPALSVGYAGTSDGFADLQKHGGLTEFHPLAQDGNVAICAELDLGPQGSEVELAIGFGRDANEASLAARASLMEGFSSAETAYAEGWREWQRGLVPLDDLSSVKTPGLNAYRVSTAVLRTHEARASAGGMIASLSIPWGASKGDDDLGGYHLVWPRDLVESATALLAIGAFPEARRALTFLQATQEEDGHWPQNMWLDGSAYWLGLQMDETAFPILLVDMALREGAITMDELPRYWLMVRHAARYIVLNGPVTGQDRWEEDGGYSPFTLAVEIAALVVAADLATRLGHVEDAAYLLDTADLWNASIERWTFATGTELAKQLGISGYYVRITPVESSDAPSPLTGFVAIKNRPPAFGQQAADATISPDALSLVRFGLRSADDQRILDTITAIDHLLKVELPQGPLWHRYNGDGYGEHEDGSPFDGTGIGRAWPLLTGERAHYELSHGRPTEARRLLAAFEGSGSEGGLLPEQVWDSDDVPERELFRGKPSGSAMPLVWAHGEHVKLLRSLRDNVVFDMPAQVRQRYVMDATTSDLAVWRFSNMASTLVAGRTLRVELLTAARIHWSRDDWATVADTETKPTSFGVHVADLDTAHLKIGETLRFSLFWPKANRWEGQDFALRLVAPDEACPADAKPRVAAD